MLLRLTKSDRVLVLAPHPDDESIACGGLLLASRAAGAARRVVLLTDGDNNPWPQRWIEKRWRIDAIARARWGSRRRAEAQTALDTLGVDADARAFFAWPDLGVTALLMHEPARTTQALVAQIEAFRPTHVAMPALTDEHPDHSAAHIAARFAIARANAPTPECLLYAIHGVKSDEQAQVVELDASQRELKQRAILQHETQMRLSRKRFVEFATRDEIYRAGAQSQSARSDHPLAVRIDDQGMLALHLDIRRMRRISSMHLLLAIDAADGMALRWRIPLGIDAMVQIRDLASGGNVGTAHWRREDHLLHAQVKLPLVAPLRLGFCKLAQNRAGLVVYDRYGWQIVPPNRA